ncbi:MAG: hypothetical protein L0Y44_05215, partial [Phycisphaerales bacterium]|nr:hypothetical protein [Phycisphaerales bacterium]
AFETVTGKTQHKFRHPATKFLVEIFEARMDDPHERSRFDRRRVAPFLDRQTFYPTAEDVIIGKLRWFKQIRRRKDHDDLVKVMRRQWSTLDWPYINHWCNQHGTLELLDKLKSQTKPSD